jgi:hypothetical protein
MGFSARRICIAGLAGGLLSNLLGLAGNRILLRDEWDRAHVLLPATLALPYPHGLHETISISFDFILCLTVVWLYAQFGRRSAATALALAFAAWVSMVLVLYAAMANSGFLPWPLAMKSAALGLVIWLPLALFLPQIFPDRPQATR